MSQRRRIEHHRHNLGEIREIMNSMKSLAYIESQKITRHLDAQRAVVATMDRVAGDFASFHSDVLPAPRSGAHVHIAIGSERGFCGDLNHAIARELATIDESDDGLDPLLVLVGHKLHAALERNTRVGARLDGAGTVEEIGPVLHSIVAELDRLQRDNDVVLVTTTCMSSDGDVITREVLPPFSHHGATTPAHAEEPVLNVAPTRFLLGLTEHYVLAVLHAILYESLMAENHRRIAHLEGAIRHLDGQTERLARRANALRQEEIIEEIEVILLNAMQSSPRSTRKPIRSP